MANETRITGIASVALLGYQPVAIDTSKGIDYAVKAASNTAEMIGFADVPTEAGARVPIVTHMIRTNGYVGTGGVAYGDKLALDENGDYVTYVDPTSLGATPTGAEIMAFANAAKPVGIALETVSAGGVADILLY